MLNRPRLLAATFLVCTSLAAASCQSPGLGLGGDLGGPLSDDGLSRGSICAKPRTENFGPAGGRIVIGADESPALAGLSIQIPGGALNGQIALMVTCGEELAGPGERPLSASVRLLPEAQTFITPVTLTLPMSETTPPDSAEVVVAVRSAGQLTYLTGSDLHPGPTAGSLNVEVSHLGDYEVVARTTQTFPPTQNIDVLFVMDNSPSMAPKQRALARQIPLFIQKLDMLGLDYHIGVVSTDIGTNVDATHPWGGNVGTCDTFLGDDGVMQAAACTSRGGLTAEARNACAELCPDDRFVPNNGQPFISKVSGVTNVPVNMVLDPMTGKMVDRGPINAFQCMALLGDSGCGVESPLEAVRRALDGHRADNKGFLRSGSLLAVIFLTDEDDCSVQFGRRTENNPVTMDCPSPDQNAPAGCFNLDYRCLARSVTCDQPMNTAGVKTNCKERPANYLEATSTYTKFLHTLRPDSRLVIGGIWTLPAIDKGGKLVVARGGGTASPFLNRAGAADASCAYASDMGIYGQAQLRLSTFAAGFADAQQYSICDIDNFARSVDLIAKTISDKVKK